MIPTPGGARFPSRPPSSSSCTRSGAPRSSPSSVASSGVGRRSLWLSCARHGSAPGILRQDPVAIPTSRVRGWRGALRVRCVNSTRFRGGAQSGSRRSVSTPCPPNRTCGFPVMWLSSGIMPLARGTPVRGHTHGAGGLRSSGCQRLHGFTRAVSLAVAPPGLFTPRRHRASIRPGPFAYACDASELSAPSRGVRRQSHSRRLSLLRHPSTPEAPFLDGHPGRPTAFPY